MAKVAVVRCGDYGTGAVFGAVKRAVDLIGGIESFVKPGMMVLLKPNLLSPRPPEDAVDTHPEVVRAAARLAKATGGRVILGDSPGGYGKNIDEILTASGMRKMAEEEGIELVKFTSSKFIDGIPLSRWAMDSDCIISIPKLKTHCITVLTAAVKNTFGMVTGLYKAECHSKAPKEDDFAKIIAKVHSMTKPHLNILDGIIAMEGDGPSSGRPRKMEVLMASADAVAMDSCIAKMIGLEPLDIFVTREAYKMGLGEADPARIEITGDDVASFITEDFELPQTLPLKFLPKALAHSVANFVRFKPFIDRDVCRRCNLCRISCPVGAINTNDGDYTVNYKRCIRCMCCHEVCPYRAITIRRNILTKMIWG